MKQNSLSIFVIFVLSVGVLATSPIYATFLGCDKALVGAVMHGKKYSDADRVALGSLQRHFTNPELEFTEPELLLLAKFAMLWGTSPLRELRFSRTLNTLKAKSIFSDFVHKRNQGLSTDNPEYWLTAYAARDAAERDKNIRGPFRAQINRRAVITATLAAAAILMVSHPLETQRAHDWAVAKIDAALQRPAAQQWISSHQGILPRSAP